MAGSPLNFAFNPLDSVYPYQDLNFENIAPAKNNTNTKLKAPPLKRESIDIDELHASRSKQIELPDIPIPDNIPFVKTSQAHQEKNEIAKGSTPQFSKQNQIFDNSSFNERFEQEQMNRYYMLNVMNDNRNNMQVSHAPQMPSINTVQTIPVPPPSPLQQEQGYFDKIFSKKKEFLKLIQWILIIVFAISLHFFIDHYIRHYLETKDLSFERELLLRALYPVGVLFILWNIRVFTK